MITPVNRKASVELNEICSIYEYINHRHAKDILILSFPKETLEICSTLKKIKISSSDIKARGGNESPIPKKFSNLLNPLGWKEVKLVAKQIIEETIFLYKLEN